MSINTRSSVIAIKPEVTEGTPVQPAASTDYVASQDDFSMEPSFDVLENAELKASLGKSKSILGAENPSASFSHYLRHSGVEGQAPNYKELLEAAFGAEVVEATEYDTVGGSTTTIVEVDSGEGVEFERGQPLLIKDSTNGYSIRPVQSVSTDSLTLGFALDNAPALGVNLGKAVFYKPAESGHQSLSIWHYVGNGGALQMMSGSRVISMDVDFSAGELINVAYGLEGLEYFFNPLEVTATDTKLDWTDDGGTEVATIATGFYKYPQELASAIETAMNNETAETITCTYSNSTGKFTIASSTSAVLSLLWNTGANTANTIAEVIGFSAAADDTGALTYEGDSVIDIDSPQSASFDSADPLAAKNHRVFIGDQADNACIEASSVSLSLGTPRREIEDVCAVSGASGSVINAREVTISVTALLNQYDSDKFERFVENSDTRFMYAFGEKSGGNWIAGKSGMLYVPTATVTSFNVTDDDGLATLEMELTAYVDSDGNGEVYLGFV